MKRISNFWILLLTVFFLLACENQNTEGQRLYQTHCLNCHQEGGKGVGKLIPPISGDFLKENHNQIPCMIRNGLSGKISVDGKTYEHEMPGNTKITDFDLVNVLNYIEEKYGSGEKESFNIEEVRNNLLQCN